MVAEMVMSAVFGVGLATDAYYAAIRIPQLLRELLAEGSLQNAFVPAFSEASEKEGIQGAWRLASALLGVLLCVLGGTVLLFWFGAPLLVRGMAEGFTDNAEKYALTVSLTRWMSPFLVGLSLAGFASAMLNVRGRFFWPAMAQNAFNALIIVSALGSSRFADWSGLPPIVAVALATTLVPGPRGEAIPLDRIALYAREGAIVPLLRETVDSLAPATDPDVDSYADDPGVLTVRLYPGDGRRAFETLGGTTITVEGDTVTLTGDHFTGYVFELHGRGGEPVRIERGPGAQTFELPPAP
jgi:hypothetical protein